MTRRVLEEPEPVADLSLPVATVREREQEWQRGGLRGKKAGAAGAPGRASRGSPPPSRGFQTLQLPLGPLVGGSVGRWVSGLQLGYRLSCSKVGGTRERPAHLSRLERSSAPGQWALPTPLGPLRGRDWEPPLGHCLGNGESLDPRTSRGIGISVSMGSRACPRRDDRNPSLLWAEDWEEGITSVNLLRISTQPCPESRDSPHPYRCQDVPGDALGGRSPQLCVVFQSSAQSAEEAA